MFTEEQKAELSADLRRSHVKSRSQSGRTLSYIEGWVAIAEANRIFGFDEWTRETVEMRCVHEGQREIGERKAQGWGVSYVAKVRVTVAGVLREGYGTGHGVDRDLGLAHESALKEAETDAMKRALMTFGNQFGLALYDKTQAHVSDGPAPEAKYDPADIPAAAPKRQSSHSLRNGQPDLWPAFERAMRSAGTLEALNEGWNLYSKGMLSWPIAWQEAADEEFEKCMDAIRAVAA